jgi:hypothetical protein
MLAHMGELAHLTVLDVTGRAVTLASLWQDRVAVLVFVRHFGCVHSRSHAIQLTRDFEQFRRSGVEVCIIGNGEPKHIPPFLGLTRWPGPFYTDPTLAVFRAAHLRRGYVATFCPNTWYPTLKAWVCGGRQGCTQGDQTQQGGVVVVAPGGAVTWHHVSQFPGDNATTAQIVEAVQRLQMERA